MIRTINGAVYIDAEKFLVTHLRAGRDYPELTEWCKARGKPFREVWRGSRWYMVFDDPDVAFEFKMRWC
ncbi:hypothetical protein SAMN02799636_04319 [Methylobacterium sp. 275MFSha3.1]|nr:hypothetical protein SAMN02799636_04319 [Methylobacterium sp. 275MFSha3.1]